MISIILLSIIIFLVTYKCYAYAFYKPDNFPPGPPKIPWLGSYIFMLILDRKHLHRAINRLCKYYNSTCLGMYLGDTPVIVLNDHKNVKKALLHRDFDGKPDILMGRLRDPHFGLYGIFFTDGQLWFEQRRFSLRYLRDFGFGRRFDSLEHEISTNIQQFFNIIKEGPMYSYEMKYFKKGQIKLPHAFGGVFLNSLLPVIIREAVPRENMDNFYGAIESAINFQRSTDNYGKLFSLLPILTKICPETCDYKMARESAMNFRQFFKNIIDEAIRTYDDGHERHFIDLYIKKWRDVEKTTPELSTFSYEQLLTICVDFALPTSSVMPTILTYIVQQICLKPEVQQKIQSEIDQVVGQGRMPNLDDRINLPYTEACLREILRFEVPNPSGLPHKALIDTEFLGYNIPKGTFVITALDAAHHDPNAFENPNKFQPERFLDQNGKLSLQKDISLSFGAGKRLCAGETFARNSLFLVTAAFFQTFSVRMANGRKPYEFTENNTGTFKWTPDHWIEVIPR